MFWILGVETLLSILEDEKQGKLFPVSPVFLHEYSMDWQDTTARATESVLDTGRTTPVIHAKWQEGRPKLVSLFSSLDKGGNAGEAKGSGRQDTNLMARKMRSIMMLKAECALRPISILGDGQADLGGLTEAQHGGIEPFASPRGAGGTCNGVQVGDFLFCAVA